MTLAELKEKWEELFIRFNTSPKLYLKIDFLKLLKFLKNIVDRGTGLIEDDLKTINGESLVGDDDFSLVEKDHIKTINGESLIGDGNIEIKGLSIEEGNAISIKDVPIYSEPTFLGYAQINSWSTTLDDLQNILILDNSDPNAETYYYKLVAEEQESTHITTELTFEHFVGTKLYFDDECTEYIGTVTNAAIANNKVLYFSLDTPLEQLEGQIPRNQDGNHNFISVWGIIQMGVKSDTKEISVTSHIYDEENNNCKFGRDNTIKGEHSVAFGSNNEIEDLTKNPIEFIGYCKAPNSSSDEYFYIDDEDYTLVPHGTDVDDRLFHYKLLSERSEDAGTCVEDIPDLVGSVLYADSEGTMPLGIVSKSMYAYGMHYGEYTAIIYFSLEQYPTDIPRSFISVWRLIPADKSENSIVHGFSNLVCADNAHAEGKDTEALENQAHSEGEFTVAQGINSHSEGQYTTAFGTASHAEGEGGLVTLFRTLYDINNSDTIRISILSATDSDFGSDSALSFLAGSDFLSDSDSDGVLDINAIEKGKKINGWVGRPLYLADGSLIGIVTSINSLGRELTIDRNVTLLSNTPIYIKTSATGEDSHTEGFLTDASGVHSHAEGERTQATGTNAHAEGFKTRAFGADSHAEGYGTAAYTFGSHAEGKLTQVEGEYSHTEGYDTKASGTYAHGEGNASSALGDWSHAEGEDSKSSGVGSHAEGIRCRAQGAYSHAEGYNTSTEGNFEDANSSDHSEKWQVAAHAEGKDTQAAQTASHSEGINTRADGDAAHAEGVDSKSLSRGAHAEGINTFVNEWSEGSHTEGYETQTDSNYSHAEGWKTVVQNKSEYVNRSAKVKLKSYDSSTRRITIELVDGNFYTLSQSFVERKNSLVELKTPEGNTFDIHNFITYLESYPNLIIRPRYANWAVGKNENKSYIDESDIYYLLNNYPNAVYQVSRVEYEGYGAHAEGGETLVEGTFAHAEGEHSKALKRGAHAEGFHTQAKEEYSHAEGWFTKATHKAEHAQGRCNKSNDIHINTPVEYVDLGLPSGNLWATCNIGATNPEDYGDFYAWGEVETKEDYSWNTYKWCNGTNDTFTKYCTDPDYWDGNTPNPDGLTRLVLDDDVAAKTLGENWRIPSKKDFEELIEYTDNEWTSVNGVNGRKFINKSDSDLYIFLPAAGFIDDQSVEDRGGYLNYFMSLCKDIYYAYILHGDSDSVATDYNGRQMGCSIRPVSSKLKTIHSVGVGESDGDHRNALEITTDGSIFVKGVGNYDGSNPQSAKSLQLLLLNVGNGESGLSPETAIVIAAALNDLNDRINELLESSTS